MVQTVLLLRIAHVAHSTHAAHVWLPSLMQAPGHVSGVSVVARVGNVLKRRKTATRYIHVVEPDKTNS